MLCYSCNSGLSFLKDDPDLMRTAILYLGGLMDTLTVIDAGEKRPGNHEFAVGFRVNPKALSDKEEDLNDFTLRLMSEAGKVIREHLAYLVDGQLSAIDATRR